jgi:hypothetical protein
MDFGLGFVMVTFVTTDVPTPTSPKSTAPGTTWTKVSGIATVTAVPQPDAIASKQHITAKATAANGRPTPRGPLASQTGSRYGFREFLRAEGMSEYDITCPHTARQNIRNGEVLEN